MGEGSSKKKAGIRNLKMKENRKFNFC